MRFYQRFLILGFILILANGCSKKENQIAVEPPAPQPKQEPVDSSGLNWAKKSSVPLTSVGIFAAGDFPEGVKVLVWDTDIDFPRPVIEFGKIGKVILSLQTANVPVSDLLPKIATDVVTKDDGVLYKITGSEGYGFFQNIKLGSQTIVAGLFPTTASNEDAKKVWEAVQSIKQSPDFATQAQKQADTLKELETKGVRTDYTGLGVKVFVEGKSATDESVASLASLLGITELTIRNADALTVKGFESLGKLPSVVRLTLVGRCVTDPNINQLSKYKLVHTLSIEDHRLTDTGLNAFDSYTNLRHVSIASGRSSEWVGPSKLSCMGISAFRFNKKIAKLELEGEHISGLGFSSISELKSLKELSIKDAPRAGQGFGALNSCQNLTRLTLANVAVTDLNIKGVQFPALVSLHTANTLLQNPFPSWKTTFPLLTHLQLDQSLVNDTTLALVSECSLEALSVKGTALTDACFDSIAKLTNLKSLNLDSTRIEGAKLDGLKGLTKLANLGLQSTPIKPENVAKLGEVKTLVHLDLRATSISDADLKPLATLEKLASLDVSGTKVKGAGLVPFGVLKDLKSVRLEDASGSFAGINEAKKALGEKLKAPEYPQPVAIGKVDPPIPLDKLPAVALDALNQDGKKAVLNHEDKDRLKPIIEAKLSGAITDADLGHLRNLKDLQVLEIADAAKVTDAGLSYLAGFTQLETFTLKNTGVKGAGLGVLAQFKRLRVLNLEGIPLDPTHLEILGKIPTLERVKITVPVEEQLELFAKLPNLKTVALPPSTLSDRRVEMLTACKNLEELFLIGSANLPITDRSAKVLEQFKNLNSLTLDSTQITDVGMESISKLENLNQLTLGKNVNIKNPLAKLKPLKKLERLLLPRVSLGNDFSGLSGLENLHSLNLSATDATDSLSNSLGGLKDLEDLNLSSTIVSDPIIERLKSCPEIRILNFSGTRVTGKGFGVFKDQEELKLGIVNLREAALTDDGLIGLGKATSIEVLDLSFTNISDTGLENIRDLKRLKQLDLEGCKKLTDKSIGSLKLFKNLAVLNLEGTAITGDGVAELKKLLPDCEIKGK